MTLNRYGIFPPGNENVLKLVVQVAIQPDYSQREWVLKVEKKPMSNTFQTVLLTEEKRNIWTSTATAGGESLTSELAGTGGSSHSNCLPVLWR